MSNWHVIHTQPQRESQAYQHLIAQGFEAYFPRFSKVRKHARKVDTVLAPLFPRYIFVKFDAQRDQWRAINGTRGVSYVLCAENHSPSIVPDAIIESLRARESNGLITMDQSSPFSEGDRVIITDGAFKDHTGLFKSMDDQHRISLLLSFLGRDLEVRIPHHLVDVA